MLNFRQTAQYGVNRFAQSAGSFSMDDPDFKEILLPANTQVFWQQFCNVFRVESVQIQLSGYRIWNWLLHNC